MTSKELHFHDRTVRDSRPPSCFRVLVCHSSPCRAAGAEAVYRALVQTVRAHHLAIEVEVNTTGCTARCTDGPLLTVCMPGKKDAVYTNVTPECISEILAEQIPGLDVRE